MADIEQAPVKIVFGDGAFMGFACDEGATGKFKGGENR